MKKTLKKTIAFTLTFLLLFSCFSVQSFATFKFDEITNVEVIDYEKFSYKEIEEYISWLEEDVEELVDEDYQYVLYCDADVTISSDEVISVRDMDYGYSQNKKRVVDVYAYVDVRECKSAYEKGEYTVPLYVEVVLESSIGIELDRKIIEKEATFVECFVDSLSLVSGEIKAYELEESYYLSNLEGLGFDIVYGDGSQVSATVEKVAYNTLVDIYTLDG